MRPTKIILYSVNLPPKVHWGLLFVTFWFRTLDRKVLKLTVSSESWNGRCLYKKEWLTKFNKNFRTPRRPPLHLGISPKQKNKGENTYSFVHCPMFGGGSLFTGSNLEHKFTGNRAVALKGRLIKVWAQKLTLQMAEKMITFPKMVAAPLPKRTRVFRVCLTIWEVSKYLFGLPRLLVLLFLRLGRKFGEIYALFRLFAGLHQIRTLLHHKANKSRWTKTKSNAKTKGKKKQEFWTIFATQDNLNILEEIIWNKSGEE